MSNAKFVGSGGPHDVGLIDIPVDDMKIDQVDKTLAYWERSIHALLALLSTKKPKALLTTDELRRAVEGMEKGAYQNWGYYERWSVAIATIMLERQVITQDELDYEINGESKTVLDSNGKVPILFKEGDLIRVKSEDTRLRWRKPHLRCPGYIFGLKGKVNQYIGHFDDPYLLAFRGTGPQQPLYSVSFNMKAVASNSTTIPYDDVDDTIDADVYQEWMTPLEPVVDHHHDVGDEHKHEHDHHHSHGEGDVKSSECCGGHSSHDHNHDHKQAAATATHEHEHGHAHHSEHSEHSHEHRDSSGHSHSDEHEHEHEHAHSHSVEGATTTQHNTVDHGHTHEGRYETECIALVREGEDSAGKIVGEALLRALFTKGVVTRDEIRSKIEQLDSVNVNMAGADVVVRCWRDPAFQQRLLQDGPSACRELGLETSNPNAPTVLRVYANTDTLHHVVVCTLCSCYPFKLLGYSPAWYKSRNYRARVVKEPRKVLAEFGTVLPDNVKIKILDSTADCRYMVIPQPPQYLRDDPEAMAALTDAELRALVTRDSMVGVTLLN